LGALALCCLLTVIDVFRGCIEKLRESLPATPQELICLNVYDRSPKAVNHRDNI